ncbi:arylsulfatase [Crateriforma spongiae]|uniref:arylsulfatase n=1 Tax=Crateriforma spongiae TaxID=2724528 RepID=UPI00144674CA|nr:arylsulfatase [Crateriforma spongiae]
MLGYIHRSMLAASVCLFFGTVLAFADTAMQRPNVVLILADDLGYSDLGCYGGEIQTPRLDQLAKNGLRFARFYNSHKCEPTRASLVSGQYWHDCGLGIQTGLTMGQAMRGQGYATIAVGKWHLNGNPIDRGFDHYFGHLSGASNYFKGHPSHRLYDQPFQPKDDRFYTTDANADYTIEFIDKVRQGNPDQPFFVYLAFNAPHGPLQAWPDDVARYRGKYKTGWDQLRRDRYQRQLQMGLVRSEWALPRRPDTIPAWDELSAEDQDFEDLRFSTYAAMVDRMDQAIGRVVDHLSNTGELDNTLILFLSDNGASPYDRGRRGTPPDGDSAWEYGVGWAHLSNTPFRHYKRNVFNGGSCTPLIAHWPAGMTTDPGSITDQPGHIIDLMATLIDVSGGRWPQQANGQPLRSFPGKSLVPIFQGKQRRPHDALYFHLFDHRAIIAGDWKLASDWSRPWQLFDLRHDRTETNDLASNMPGKVAELQSRWDDWFPDSMNSKLRSEGDEPVYRSLGEISGDDGKIGDAKATKRKGRSKPSGKSRVSEVDGVRARIGTTITLKDGVMVMQCRGDDPGLAIDRVGIGQRVGPFVLRMSVRSNSSGQGHVFWTRDQATKLPSGQQLPIDVVHDQQWHDLTVRLEADPGSEAPVFGIRVDLCEGPGRVEIKDLRLEDTDGNVLKRWPSR